MGTIKQDIESRVRGLVLDGCQVIVVTEQYVYHLLMQLRIKTTNRIGILKLRNFDDMMALDERALIRLGWVKKEKVDSLFEAIKHGDDAHQAWLREAIEKHFEVTHGVEGIRVGADAVASGP